MKVCNLQFVVLLFLVAPLLKCFQTPLCYPFLYLRTRLRNASQADYWDTWKWNYNIRDSWFVIFVVCESCLGPPSPPPSLYDPLHSTSWLNWQTNNNQGCALRAPGHLRRLTFGLGRLKIFLGRPARWPAGVVFLIYSQKAKRNCCSIAHALIFKGHSTWIHM